MDNCFYGYASELSKKERKLNLAFDFMVIAVVFVLTTVELANRKVRFRALYLRIFEIFLAFKKFKVHHMLYVQQTIKKDFDKLKINQMQPNDRIVSTLRFI